MKIASWILHFFNWFILGVNVTATYLSWVSRVDSAWNVFFVFVSPICTLACLVFLINDFINIKKQGHP